MKATAAMALALVFIVGCSKDADVASKATPPATPITTPSSSTATSGTPTTQAAPDPAKSVTPSSGTASLNTDKKGTPAIDPKAIPAKPTTTTASTSAPAGTGLYTFTYTPVVGTTSNYKMSMSIDLGRGKPMEMNSSMSTKVVKASGGKYTVESTMSGLQGFGSPGGGSDIKTTEVIDSHGKVLSAEMAGQKGNSNPFATQMSPTQGLPDHPVKVGDTWTLKQKVGKSSESTVYKLLKVEKMNGQDVATISITSLKSPDIRGAQIQLASPATLVVEVHTGIMHSLNMDMAMSTAAQASQPAMKVKTHMRMEKQ